MLDHLLAREVLAAIIQRPSQQQQVIDQGLGQKADLAIEIDQDRIERVDVHRLPEPLHDGLPLVEEPREIAVLQVFLQLALAELGAAARFGHIGQVSETRQVVAQGLRNENLSGRVGQVFLGSNHMRDLEIVVVDHGGQVVEATAVGALNHVVLFAAPIELHRTTDQVVDRQSTGARDLQTHDRGASLGFEGRPLLRGFGDPAATVDERLLGRFGRLAFRLNFRGGGVVIVGGLTLDQLPYGRLIAVQALRLEIGPVRATHFRALIPLDAQPAKAVQNGLQGRRHVALLVGIVDPQHEMAAVLAGEEPIEQRRAHAANVQVSGRTGSKTGTDHAGQGLIAGKDEDVRAAALDGNVPAAGPIVGPKPPAQKSSQQRRGHRVT